MKSQYPNLAKIELIAQVLGPLREWLVFVGGCAVDLLLTDPAAAPSRVTYDVDLVANVAALSAYHKLEAEFSRQGFTRDLSLDAPVCRWRYKGLEVDLMPADSRIIGFANQWYPLAVETAQKVVLPSGASINLITAPLFLATKFEAFADRGNNDVLGSHDLEDIINVLDGRPEVVNEILMSEEGLRSYLCAKFQQLLDTPNFMSVLPGLIFPDESLTERMQLLLLRMKEIVAC